MNMKFADIVAIREQHYLVPMAKGCLTELDGRSIDSLMAEWFRDPNSYHATRDGSRLGSADKILRVYCNLPDGSTINNMSHKHLPEEEYGLRVLYEGLKEYFERKTLEALKSKYPNGIV